MTGEVSGTNPGRGECGHRDGGGQSDLWVQAQAVDGGGVQISFDGPAPSAAQAIRRSVETTLERFPGFHGSIHILDRDAPGFAIEGRVETALRRAGFTPTLPAPAASPGRGSSRDQLRRTRLYMPGDRPRVISRAGEQIADGVIFDLEDAVHPREKDAARYLVAAALRGADPDGPEKMVRINQLPLGWQDIDAVVPAGPEMILLPKAESVEEVTSIARRIREIRRECNIEHEIWLMPILETAFGIEEAFAIARADKSVVALTIGLEDYAADLRAQRSEEGQESFYARTRMINAARAAGCQPIDSVFLDTKDLEALDRIARRSRQLGCEGMGCIHPRQVPTVNTAFDPTESEIERALAIVEVFEEATANGVGVVTLGTKMIDGPVVARAQQVVERARAVGLLPVD